MWNPEKSNDKDLLWIYWHVISLAYSVESWFFDNSTIWLTWEWWNGKTKIMNLTKDVIKKEYGGKYVIIDINPWEYSENVDFLDILLKEFWKSITWIEKVSVYINYWKIFLSILMVLVLILAIWWIFYVVWYIFYNLFFQWQSLKSMLDIWQGITFFVSPLLIFFSYIYIKTDFSFINEYLLIWEKKDRFKQIIDKKIKTKIFSKKNNEKIIFFIDDLDRCTSKQVMNILKTIVLFWNQKNSIFILWYDEKIIIENLKKELSHIKNEYDDEDNKIKLYIEKVINLQIFIPQIDKTDVSNYIDWNFNEDYSLKIENLDYSLKFLKEKDEWIKKQFLESKDFKSNLFDLINSKTPRWINTWYRTVYYSFIYLLVLKSYWYINFDPDINLLLKASILKQKFWKDFNDILLMEKSIFVINNIFKIIKQRDELNKIIHKLKKEKGKLEKEKLFNSQFSYNEILKILRDMYLNKEGDNFSMEDISDKIYEKTTFIKWVLEETIKKEKSKSLLLHYNQLIISFENEFWKYKDIKDEINENQLKIVEKNQKELIQIFSFDEIELENFINYYYNPPKINNWLFISFINVNNQQIDSKKMKELLLEYINLKDENSEESEKIMFFLSKNLILEKEKVNNLYKVKKTFIDLRGDKIFFCKLIEKIILDLEKYFNKNKDIFTSNNNKKSYIWFENIKSVIIAISRLLELSNHENINIKLFENDFMKKYFEFVIKLDLHYRIKEIWDIMLLDKFNPGLLKYYDTINKSISSKKWNKFLKDYLIKNKSKLSDKKKEVLWIK